MASGHFEAHHPAAIDDRDPIGVLGRSEARYAAGHAAPRVMVPASLRRRAQPVDRSTDRLVVLAAIGVAIGFLLAAVLGLFLPAGIRRGAWLPLHLALAGGATSAIAGAMPFFAAAFAAAPPCDAKLRVGALGGVAVGAAAVSLGVVGGQTSVAVVGGCVFVVGVVLTGVATVRPLGRALGPSRGLVTQGYVMALAEVSVGASLATLFLAGWSPLVDAWVRIKPAHAWLNLVGFASMVVATTLLHFFPTVVGARIGLHPSARLTVLALAVGAPLVAVGYTAPSDVTARLGALAVLAGAIALAVYASRTWRTRAHWTTDPAWHRFAIGGLVSAIVWFEIGVFLAAGRVLAYGADPAGWSIDAIVGPLVVGWVGLAIIASATHLLPAIGPGDPAGHARQRELLGRLSGARLAVLDTGVALLSIGLVLNAGPLTQAGAILIGLGFAATAALLGIAVAIGRRRIT